MKKRLLISTFLLICGLNSCTIPSYIYDDQHKSKNVNKKYELVYDTFKKVNVKDKIDDNCLYFDFETKGYVGLAYFEADVTINICFDYLLASGSYVPYEHELNIPISQDGNCKESIKILDNIQSYANFKCELEFSGYALVKENY